MRRIRASSTQRLAIWSAAAPAPIVSRRCSGSRLTGEHPVKPGDERPLLLHAQLRMRLAGSPLRRSACQRPLGVWSHALTSAWRTTAQ
jgi:hypothetical protein